MAFLANSVAAQPFVDTFARALKDPDNFLVILFLQILTLLVYHAITRPDRIDVANKNLRIQDIDPSKAIEARSVEILKDTTGPAKAIGDIAEARGISVNNGAAHEVRSITRTAEEPGTMLASKEGGVDATREFMVATTKDVDVDPASRSVAITIEPAENATWNQAEDTADTSFDTTGEHLDTTRESIDLTEDTAADTPTRKRRNRRGKKRRASKLESGDSSKLTADSSRPRTRSMSGK
ncbi:hypothetical protein EIP91_000623 [Steccherinum ochraceum]|uniref:Uncharacterized protein n=1 Tax=Steccherinum ochraceum TaxID=92696 RepID=A0A4R0RFR3_9APHY|nr:hypothetical protein EIP91_000623 [Steccherinum ochraceum]